LTAFRLAVLADIHGNQLALEAVLRDLKQAGGADKTWVLGDLVAFGPRPAECLETIRAIAGVEVISGNTDRNVVKAEVPSGTFKDEEEWRNAPARFRMWSETTVWAMEHLTYTDFEYLSKLSHGLELEFPGYGWAIGYHGSPGNDEYMLLPDTPAEEVLDQFLGCEGRLGFGGHTHLPMDRDLGRWRVVNVGSVGFPSDETRASYVVVTVGDVGDDGPTLEFRRVEFDVDALLEDMSQQQHPALSFAKMQFKRA
jgi:predicted phosphodiesterase